MQDLVQDYVNDLNKLRDEFHDELAATAGELSKALAHYAHRNDAAVLSFMDRASALGMELEALAAARLNQFRGLQADGGLPDVNDGPSSHSNQNSDAAKVAAAAERAVAHGLLVESDCDRGPGPVQVGEPIKAAQAA
ncbi:MAG TPA: hypothetical protein VJY34_02775 [Roseiarcus sp.]|nr:hypothetical protein [Roseiarcus sp.]